MDRWLDAWDAAGWIGVGLALVIVAASCSFVRGPVTGPGDVSLFTGFDVAQVGYQRSEYFLGGLALSYRATVPLTSDGKFSVEPDGSIPPAGFNTRMVIYRPTDPAKFNGTVVVEWLNVTAGVDWERLGDGPHRARPQRRRVGRGLRPGGGRQRDEDEHAGPVRQPLPPGRQLLLRHVHRGREADPQPPRASARRADPAAADRHRRVAIGQPARHLHRRRPSARPRL